VALGLALGTVSFQFQEVLLAWLRTRSGSIWPTCIAHSGHNMVLALITGILLEESGGLDTITVMAVTATAIAAAALLVVLGGGFRRWWLSWSPRRWVRSLARTPPGAGAGRRRSRAPEWHPSRRTRT
jgi:hypothetical protein